MQKREAKFQTIFNQYLRKKKLYGYFELKEAKNGSLPFSTVKNHQLAGLLAASQTGFVWKLSDEDQREKPFDCMYSMPMPSYIVVNYLNTFYIIPLGNFHAEMKSSVRKSLTKERAKEISRWAVTFIHS